MLEYLKIARPDHWLKNIFILFGHVVAWALVLNFQWDAAPHRPRRAVSDPRMPHRLGQLHPERDPRCSVRCDASHQEALRGIPAGKVKVAYLWWFKAALIVVAFLLCWWWKFNWAYQTALASCCF